MANITMVKNLNVNKIKASKLKALKNETSKFVQEEASRLKVRMLSGKDPDGNNLEAYSDQYADWRESLGYGRNVNLTVTGHMRNSIQTEVNENESKIEARIFVNQSSGVGVVGSQSVTAAQKAVWTNIKRKWFGVPKDSVRKFINQFVKG